MGKLKFNYSDKERDLTGLGGDDLDNDQGRFASVLRHFGISKDFALAAAAVVGANVPDLRSDLVEYLVVAGAQKRVLAPGDVGSLTSGAGARGLVRVELSHATVGGAPQDVTIARGAGREVVTLNDGESQTVFVVSGTTFSVNAGTAVSVQANVRAGSSLNFDFGDDEDVLGGFAERLQSRGLMDGPLTDWKRPGFSGVHNPRREGPFGR